MTSIFYLASDRPISQLIQYCRYGKKNNRMKMRFRMEKDAVIQGGNDFGENYL